MFIPVAALAQVPPSVQPGQVIQRFDAKPFPGARAKPAMTPVPEAPAADETEGLAFVLKKIVVDGATVYTQAELRSAAEGQSGAETGFSGLQRIAAALTAKYRADGYMLSRVVLEPQKVRDGVVRYTAVEGYVDDVEISGDARGMEGVLAAAVAEIKASRPLRAADFERALLTVSETPGARAETLLRPSDNASGASQLVISVERNRWDAALALDNRGSRFLGPWQATASVALNGLAGADRTQLRGIASVPRDELRFLDLTHERLLGARGAKLFLRAAASATQPGGGASGLGVDGDSRLYEARVSFPLLRARRRNVTAYVSGHALNSSDDLLFLPNSRDRVRSARLGAAFDAADAWGGVTALDLHLRQGLDILGATAEGAGRSRVNGRQDFTSLRASVSRDQPLPGAFSAFLAAEGQYAFDALLAAEEYAVGGAAFGRGYDAAEITGDNGAAAAVELRYTGAPVSEWLERYQLYGFYDVGAVWNRDRVALDPKRESLASAGAGLRVDMIDGFETSLEAAAPLTRPVASTGGEEMRVFLRLSATFAGP